MTTMQFILVLLIVVANVQQHCPFQLEEPLPSKNDACQQQKEIDANTDVIHGDDHIPMVACQGIQHFLYKNTFHVKNQAMLLFGVWQYYIGSTT